MSPSRNAEIAAAESRVVLETYKKWPVALVEGQGAWVTDADGRRYLDLYGGHCVSLLGHSHPRWLTSGVPPCLSLPIALSSRHRSGSEIGYKHPRARFIRQKSLMPNPNNAIAAA